MTALTLLNQTEFVAVFIIKRGEQVIARIPAMAPGSTLALPTTGEYAVSARTVIDGNTFTSAPQTVQGSMGFLAQVVQTISDGRYEFSVQTFRGSVAHTLEFQKTTRGPVTFTITKDGVPLQNVVVSDSFQSYTLDIGDTFYVYAVIDGITTATAEFTDPDATITAWTDTSVFKEGYYTLKIA